MDDLPCPSIMLDRLCFEMDKAYKETKLQLLLSPVILIAKDTVSVSVIFICLACSKTIYVNNKEGRFQICFYICLIYIIS